MKIDNPKTAADREFNDRADRFVQVLKRLRDLNWTLEDYFWLCTRKRSQLRLQEQSRFNDAVIIMDFRRATHDNPEENCEAYNRSLLRQMAVKTNVPVIRFDAWHDGVTEQKQGMELPEERFNGLAAQLEVAEGARVILILNLAVEYGLMNGTQGIIKQIVYEAGCNPNHDEPGKRMPSYLIVDFHGYAGPAFFDDASKATWVVLEPAERDDGSSDGVKRTQFPLVLGWAMTPWKAQGMTL